MKKKEFQSSFSDYKDTSNCGLESERRTEGGKGFEAYIYDENIRVINRNAHSATITDLRPQDPRLVTRSSVIFVVSLEVISLASLISAAFMVTLTVRIISVKRRWSTETILAIYASMSQMER